MVTAALTLTFPGIVSFVLSRVWPLWRRLRWVWLLAWFVSLLPLAMLVGTAVVQVGNRPYSMVISADVPYGMIISTEAKKAGLDPALLVALMRQESAFNPLAVSSAGARGLGQIMPDTADWCGMAWDAMFNPASNAACSAKYLKMLLDRYDGNQQAALAAYYAGPGTVDSYGGSVPRVAFYYVRIVMSNWYKERGNEYGLNLLYGGKAEPVLTQLAHGLDGWKGEDWATECGQPLYSPVQGVGIVTFAGLDGYSHVDGSGHVWPQNTMVTIEGEGGEATILHLGIEVEVGDEVIGGKTRIGAEAANGWATGCHVHYIRK
ncbi:MAG: M23 family metallopeptidase [Caldilineaceae bacterium]|nr:M23 family metallopeptidase [Caldilineaceae bacterium]